MLPNINDTTYYTDHWPQPNLFLNLFLIFVDRSWPKLCHRIWWRSRSIVILWAGRDCAEYSILNDFILIIYLSRPVNVLSDLYILLRYDCVALVDATEYVQTPSVECLTWISSPLSTMDRFQIDTRGRPYHLKMAFKPIKCNWFRVTVMLRVRQTIIGRLLRGFRRWHQLRRRPMKIRSSSGQVVFRRPRQNFSRKPNQDFNCTVLYWK